MKIGWLIRVPLGERDGRPYSPLAGVRMRTLVPVAELQRGSDEATIVQLPDSCLLDDAALAVLDSCAAVVFGPLLPAPNQAIDDSASAVFALLERLQKRGIKTLADIHDDHFEMPGRIAYFTGLVQKADVVLVNSDAMAKLVADYTQRPLKVIGDPYEGPHGEARFDPAAGSNWSDRIFPWRARRLQLAWFGHQSNLQSVYDLAQTIAEARVRWPIEITLVTRDGFGAGEFCEVFNHYHGRRCRVKFVVWSPATTQQALHDCDLAVIPGDVTLRKTAVKSANRMAEILRAGRLAVAYPIPSYLEFAAHAWIGEDIIAGIEWAMTHRDEVRARIRTGQAYVEDKFSPRAMGRQWQNALHEILASPRD